MKCGFVMATRNSAILEILSPRAQECVYKGDGLETTEFHGRRFGDWREIPFKIECNAEQSKGSRPCLGDVVEPAKRDAYPVAIGEKPKLFHEWPPSAHLRHHVRG